jgi:hypothetical protein
MECERKNPGGIPFATQWLAGHHVVEFFGIGDEPYLD